MAGGIFCGTGALAGSPDVVSAAAAAAAAADAATGATGDCVSDRPTISITYPQTPATAGTAYVTYDDDHFCRSRTTHYCTCFSVFFVHSHNGRLPTEL